MARNFGRRNLMDHKFEGAGGKYRNQDMRPEFYQLVTLDPTIEVFEHSSLSIHKLCGKTELSCTYTGYKEKSLYPSSISSFTMNQESLCAKWLQCGNYRHRWYRIYTATIYTDANRRVKVGPTSLCIPPLFSVQPPPWKYGRVVQTSLELAITKENSERGDFSLLSSSFSWHEPLQISSSDGLRLSCVPCTWSKENTARLVQQGCCAGVVFADAVFVDGSGCAVTRVLLKLCLSH
ncbi:hypothetical protein E5288_WYG008821 [Bos mutus]|uniref:Uncharacterized protein n=1 Tax=Bos mutus TaxID=72004 RepID=A0A6B0RH05_9CETA|nr:hypothetical protein [Bos mutus]